MGRYLIQILAAGAGSLGFAILFNNYRGQLKLIAFGGALSWMAYLLFYIPTDSAIIAIFGSTVVVAVLAEIGARVIMTPVITLFVPMIIPLIPGGDLYRSMSFLVRGDVESFTAMSQFTIMQACAIAFGILVVTLVVQIIMKTMRYMKRIEPQKHQ